MSPLRSTSGNLTHPCLRPISSQEMQKKDTSLIWFRSRDLWVMSPPRSPCAIKLPSGLSSAQGLPPGGQGDRSKRGPSPAVGEPPIHSSRAAKPTLFVRPIYSPEEAGSKHTALNQTHRVSLLSLVSQNTPSASNNAHKNSPGET
jgi:hypothetical protein